MRNGPARNRPSSCGTCTVYAPMSTSNTKFHKKVTSPCTEDSSASSRRDCSATYTRPHPNPTRQRLHSPPLPGGSEPLGLAVPEEFVVQISWELLDQPDPPLGAGPRVLRAGRSLPQLRYPDRPLPVWLLGARWPHGARNAPHLQGDYKMRRPAFPAYYGIPLVIGSGHE